MDTAPRPDSAPHPAPSALWLDGRALRALRLAHGWSQEDLARAAGVTGATVGKLEAGVRAPKLGTARKLAAALGVPFARLVRIDAAGGRPR